MSKKYTTEEIQQMLDSTAYIDKNAGSKPVEVDTLAEAEELGNNYPAIIAQLIAEREAFFTWLTDKLKKEEEEDNSYNDYRLGRGVGIRATLRETIERLKGE